MAYATLANMIERFGEAELLAIADRDMDGEVDAEVVSAALDDASGQIDSYIGGRYALPLSGTSGQLARIACDLARWQLYTDAPHERVTEANKAALAWLRDVAAGRANLDIGGEKPQADPAGAPRFEGGPRVFTRDTLAGY